MILLLGANGYIGRAFAGELRRRGCQFIPLSRDAFDYTSFELLFDYVRKMRPELVINAAGYAGRPNVDACELNRTETFRANTLMPQMISRVCQATNTPFGHISSGCIYSGAKVFESGQMRVETDLNRPEFRRVFDSHPEQAVGFTEMDEPNFSFRSGSCSFHSGTKALAEESIREGARTYIWRFRLPFTEQDEPCNLLSKLQQYARVYDCVNSLSHLGDCVRACLDLWTRCAPYGIYNVTNPGAVTTRKIVEMIKRNLKPARRFRYWMDDQEFYREGAKAPRSSCILDVSKLAKAGVKLRPVEDALEDSLEKWRPITPTLKIVRPRPEPLRVLAR